MSELTCPGCQATLDFDREGPSIPETCPFCGADLGDLDLNLPARSDVKSKLPAGSRIVMLAPEPGQLLFQIPPGKSGAANFLLFFAVFWNGIVLVVASAFLFGAQQNPAPSLWFLIPFFGLFFLVGLLVLYFGISLKFMRVMLLLEPGRAVMQRTLFRYQSMKELPLLPGARAELVESYRQNNRPVYAVAIVSGGDSLKFGTSLGDAEKDALVKIINQHVGYEDPAAAESVKEGFIQETVAAQEVSPDALPPDTLIEVLENRPDELVISFPLVPSSGFQMFMKLVFSAMGLFAAVMVAFTVVALWKGGAVQNLPLVFLVPFELMFFVPCAIGFLILRLHVTIGINGEHVVHQISSGPFRRKKTWDSPTVTGVSIRTHVIKSKTGSGGKPGGSSTATLWSYCTLDVGEQSNWFAFGPARPFCHDVAGLVRYQLSRVGNRLIDDPGSDSARSFESLDNEN